MEEISQIISFREKNGFNAKNYLKYAKTKQKENIVYKTEHFLARTLHFINNHRLARKFIKKAQKNINNNQNISPAYKSYINAIYMSVNKRNSEALTMFKEARLLGLSSSRWVKEIDGRIYELDNAYVPERIINEWNGLKILFVNESEKKDFIDKKLNKEEDYQNRICNFIIKFEMLKAAMEKLIASKPKKYKSIYEKAKKLEEKTVEFSDFLGSNFTECKYVSDFVLAIGKLKNLYFNINEYESARKIEEFDEEIPEMFEHLVKYIKTSIDGKKISYKKARRMVVERFENSMIVEDTTIYRPFPPVFYDVAFDYIHYPMDDEKKITGMFRKFSLFSKKK